MRPQGAVARRWLLAGLWVYVCAAGATQDEGAERARIAHERVSVEQNFAQRERECRTRFAVTACVDDARLERREALTLLRRQLIVLDEAQRKQRAAQRMQAIRAKVSESEARQSDPFAREPRALVPKPDLPSAAASTLLTRDVPRNTAKTAPTRQLQRSAPLARDRTARAERNKKSFEASLEEAAAHREALERRNAQRSAKRKPALPLPTPASAVSP